CSPRMPLRPRPRCDRRSWRRRRPCCPARPGPSRPGEAESPRRRGRPCPARRLPRGASWSRARPEAPAGSGRRGTSARDVERSEEHTSELQSRFDLVCRLRLEEEGSAAASLAALDRIQAPDGPVVPLVTRRTIADALYLRAVDAPHGLPAFPTRRSSDLPARRLPRGASWSRARPEAPAGSGRRGTSARDVEQGQEAWWTLLLRWSAGRVVGARAADDPPVDGVGALEDEDVPGAGRLRRGLDDLPVGPLGDER